MLRLDPSLPALWRTPHTLQIGVDAVAVIDDPAPWQQRLLAELTSGLPENAVGPVAMALGAPEDEVEPFTTRLGGALVRESTRQRTVDVIGSAPVADAVADGLRAAGWQARLRDDGDVSSEVPVVVVAHAVVEPAVAARLMHADIAHLPVVFADRAVEVGPWVVPGQSGCLACAAAHRRDRDPHWPVLVSQLVGRPLPELPPGIALEAGLIAARLLSEFGLSATDRRAMIPTTVTLRHDGGRRRVAAPPPHPECRCRSLARSATATDPAGHAPTSPTDLAVPA